VGKNGEYVNKVGEFKEVLGKKTDNYQSGMRGERFSLNTSH
jgi:hypothetical protein